MHGNVYQFLFFRDFIYSLVFTEVTLKSEGLPADPSCIVNIPGYNPAALYKLFPIASLE